MGKLIKNYIYNVLYQMLVILAPLITAPYLARVLGADALGQYGYVYTVASIIGTIGLLGLYNYGTRQIAYSHNSKEETNYVFWEIMTLRLILLIPGIAVFMIIGMISRSTILFLVYAPWLIASYVDVSWLCVGKEDMKPAVCKNAFAKIASIIGIFVFVHKPSDVWKYLALIAASTFVANASVWFSLNKYVERPRIRRDKFSEHLKGALLLFLPQVTSMIYLQVDKVMLKWMAGNEQIAFYDQAEKIINIPLAFITVLSTVMMPRIASEVADNHEKNIFGLINNALKYSLFVAIPMAFGIAGISSRFIPWYLGEDFLPVITAIYFISPIIIFNSLSGVFGTQYLTATDQTNILTRAYGVAAVINVLINACLIPSMAYKGAAIATQISSLVSVLIQYRFVRKQINVHIFEKTSANYLIYGLIMFVAVYLIGKKLGVGILTTFIQIAVGIFVYGILLIITKDPMLKSFKRHFQK